MLALFSRVVFPSHSGSLSMLAAAPKMTVEERTSRRQVFEMAVKTISALTGVSRAHASPQATVAGSKPPQRRRYERPSDPRLRRHLPRPRRTSEERDLLWETAVNPIAAAAAKTRIQRPLVDLCSASRTYLQPREVAPSPKEEITPRTKPTPEIPLFHLEPLSLKGRLIIPIALCLRFIY